MDTKKINPFIPDGFCGCLQIPVKTAREFANL